MWAKLSLWAKLAIGAIGAALTYIAYLHLKSKSLETEAANLRRANIAKKAEVKAAYLEGQKAQNSARIDQLIDKEESLDEQLLVEQKKAEEAKARIAGLTDRQIANRFKELGF